jgi:hypothetical protein
MFFFKRRMFISLLVSAYLAIIRCFKHLFIYFIQETAVLYRRMPSPWILRHVALVRTGVSEELSASIIMVTIGEVGTTPAVTFLRSVRQLLVTASVVPSSPILVTLMMEALSSTKTSVPKRDTRLNLREDVILHSHRRENLRSSGNKIAGAAPTLRGTRTQTAF